MQIMFSIHQKTLGTLVKEESENRGKERKEGRNCEKSPIVEMKYERKCSGVILL